MSSRYTEDQLRAIDSIGCDTLISAAAGSGKTAVLVERILKLISCGDSIRSMLIVTFTNAAAAEMKERIKKALQKRYEEALEQKNHKELEYYLSEIRKLQMASISTLHSFCIEVIKKYSYLIELPQMRIAEEAELGEIAEKCAKDLFLGRYEAEDAAFEKTLNTVAGGKDKKLYDTIRVLNEFSKSIERPHEWLNEIIKQYENEDIEKSGFYRQLEMSFDSDIKKAAELDERALLLAEDCDEKAATVLKNEMDNIKALMGFDGENKKKCLLDFSFATLRFSKDADPQIKQQIQGLRDQAKKTINDLKKSVFCLPESELLRRQKHMLPIVDTLTKLTIEFDEAFLKEKQERSIMDFSDLEHYALKILENESVRDFYKNKYAHIFIDEYQDTNAVQEAIIRAIKRADNLFMVGDVKQSVYRFRQADPTLFIEKYETFGNNEKNERGLSIDLRANFRSTPGIIEVINAIFEKNMSKELGEILYDDRAKLTAGFETKGPTSVSVHMIDGSEAALYEDEEEPAEALSDAQREALVIYEIIKECVGQKYYDLKSASEREITYGDIAILMRSAKGYIGPLSSALIKLGVPCYEDNSSLEFSAQEVTLMLSMLKIIDNIKEDTALLGVMHSIIGAFTVDELIEIRGYNEEGLFYDALRACAAQDSALGMKTTAFLQKIYGYIALKNVMPVSELIERILSESAYYIYVGALPSGKTRQMNLDALLYKARFFQSNIGGNLYEFILYIQRTIDKGDGPDAASIKREQNLVRIMTVHKSKGLEFPVVIIAGAGKNIRKPYRNDYNLHKKLGMGIKYIELEQHIKTGSLSYAAIKDINEKEGMSEELRIMYVALTRAIAHLAIVGQVKDTDKNINKWQYFQPSNARSWFDWIMPVLIQNPELFSFKTILKDDSRQLSNNIITKEDFIRAKESIMAQDPSAASGEVERRLSFVYAAKSGLSAKTSVTALTKQGESGELSFKVPEFIEHQENLATFKGTATHELLSRIDLNASSSEQIEEQIEMLKHRGILSGLEAAYIDLEAVKAFLNSGMAERMRNAKQLRREQPFTIKKQLEGSETLVQGIIDCCFIEQGQWVLLDFKTDAVYQKNSIKERAEHYRGQLELYKEALEGITGLKVKEAYIYFLAKGELYEM